MSFCCSVRCLVGLRNVLLPTVLWLLRSLAAWDFAGVRTFPITAVFLRLLIPTACPGCACDDSPSLSPNFSIPVHFSLGSTTVTVLEILGTVRFLCDVPFPQGMDIEDGRAGQRVSFRSRSHVGQGSQLPCPGNFVYSGGWVSVFWATCFSGGGGTIEQRWSEVVIITDPFHLLFHLAPGLQSKQWDFHCFHNFLIVRIF